MTYNVFSGTLNPTHFTSQMANFWRLLRLVVLASRVQHVSDLHPKFALRPHHVWRYGRRLLDNSRIRQLADWTTRGLDNSRIRRTGQVADWTTRGCHHRLCVLTFRSFGGMRDRELSSPRLVQSASWRIRELSSYLVDVQSAPAENRRGKKDRTRNVGQCPT